MSNRGIRAEALHSYLGGLAIQASLIRKIEHFDGGNNLEVIDSSAHGQNAFVQFSSLACERARVRGWGHSWHLGFWGCRSMLTGNGEPIFQVDRKSTRLNSSHIPL